MGKSPISHEYEHISQVTHFLSSMYVNIICIFLMKLVYVLSPPLYHSIRADYTVFAFIALTVPSFLIVKFPGPGIRISGLEAGSSTYIQTNVPWIHYLKSQFHYP